MTTLRPRMTEDMRLPASAALRDAAGLRDIDIGQNQCYTPYWKEV